MNSRTQSIASFARDFFGFLEQQGVQSAVLHGGENGFEGELSDVDLVVESAGFERVAQYTRRYCEQSGWLLCQILHHETTASYLVCCNSSDPAQAVALDVCSDYQRNGTFFLSADQLLKDRVSLSWGGFGLDPGTELIYRFAKSAAKGKDFRSSHEEFALYDDSAKRTCSAWLAETFGIRIGEWNEDRVANALDALRKCCRNRPSLSQTQSLNRVVSRMLHPTGMVVVTGEGRFRMVADELRPIFGDLFFRKFREAPSWQPALVKSLLMSTLIIVPSLPFPWRTLIPGMCQFHVRDLPSQGSISLYLAARLAERCARYNA